MDRVIMPKSTYIYGEGEVENLAEHVKKYGTKSFIIIDSMLVGTMKQQLIESFDKTDSICKVKDISETCSRDLAYQLLKEANDFDHIIGIGNGDILDTAKAVAHLKGSPFIIVPFITFTNASSEVNSNISVKDYFIFARTPDMIIIDKQAVANAPVPFIVKGIEDTLSVFFEIRAAIRYSEKVYNRKDIMSFELMKLKKCYAQLLNYGIEAVRSVGKNLITPQLETVLRACLYINYSYHSQEGLSVHSQYAVIHAVCNGLSQMNSEARAKELSFAAIVLLVLENINTRELFEVLSFFWELGLPIRLKDLGIHDVNAEKMKQVAKSVSAQKKIFSNQYMKPAEIVAAIITADSIGNQFLIEKEAK